MQLSFLSKLNLILSSRALSPHLSTQFHAWIFVLYYWLFKGWIDSDNQRINLSPLDK